MPLRVGHGMAARDRYPRPISVMGRSSGRGRQVRPVRWAQAVTADERVTAAGVTVAMALALHCNGTDTPMSHAPVSRIAKWCRRSDRWVQGGLKELAGLGWVTVVHRHRKGCAATRCPGCKASLICLVRPAEWVAPPVDNPEDNPVGNPVHGMARVHILHGGGAYISPPGGAYISPL
jgi:hypothetical protein